MIGPGGGKCFRMPWGSCFEVQALVWEALVWTAIKEKKSLVIYHLTFLICHLRYQAKDSGSARLISGDV